jgi:hypothetical protein
MASTTPWSLVSTLSNAAGAAKAAAVIAAKATHAAASAVAPELTASTLAAASAAHGAASAAASHVAVGASSTAARAVDYASGVASAELASARAHLLREAEGVKTTVAKTARLHTGDEPLSPELLALLAKDGFEAAPGAPGKWVKSGAVRVPWRLLPDVEGTVTVAQARDGAGAAGVLLEVDCPRFPPFMRPSAYETMGVFEIPIPSCGLAWGALKMGFFACVPVFPARAYLPQPTERQHPNLQPIPFSKQLYRHQPGPDRATDASRARGRGVPHAAASREPCAAISRAAPGRL